MGISRNGLLTWWSTLAGVAVLVLAGTSFVASAQAADPRAPALNNVGGMTAFHGQVFFLASDKKHGRALWTSDGTVDGTRVVRVINPDATDLPWPKITAESYAATTNRLYFVVDDGVHGPELWVSNGTRSGTHLTRDIARDKQVVANLTGRGKKLFFTAQGKHDVRLWKSDGTRHGTVRVPNGDHAAPSGPSELFAWHGDVYFEASAPKAGPTLWRSDGTAGGTRPLVQPWPDRAEISDFAGGATKLYFVANDLSGHRYNDGIWSTDGTRSGTALVRNVNPDRWLYDPQDRPEPDALTTVRDRLLFTDDDCAHGREPWTSDGTFEGTKLLNLYPDPPDAQCGNGSSPSALTALGGQFLLLARHNGPMALWRTDGTAEGTSAVFDLPHSDGYSGVSAAQVVRDMMYVYVSSYDEGNVKDPHRVLYETDGTADGTVVVRDFTDLNTPDGLFYPTQLTAVSDRLFFVQDTTTGITPLWVSDGTPAGTVRLTR